jgi:hypothetical protein
MTMMLLAEKCEGDRFVVSGWLGDRVFRWSLGDRVFED